MRYLQLSCNDNAIEAIQEFLKSACSPSDVTLFVYDFSENHVVMAAKPLHDVDRARTLMADIAEDVDGERFALMALDTRSGNVSVLDTTQDLPATAAMMISVVEAMLRGFSDSVNTGLVNVVKEPVSQKRICDCEEDYSIIPTFSIKHFRCLE